MQAFLATDRAAEDTLPSNGQIEGLDRDSIRLVGVEADISYFVATSTTDEVCLILAAPEQGLSWTCGPIAGLSTWRNGQGAAKVVVDTDAVPDGWVKLQSFLIVKPDAASLN
ncbi:hypothetical protein [Cryobacterium sp. CG_9.6]|uniref:hypothetical protein n=1 Tax=Cryobacterium sp. CG_9.6 TaxID=2760710 RepID=UPI0024738FF6|nr:hypothetical protein [Cryobacterium sp. CG_9.6]MDH6236568.1 hypothetical protein [Cryobacterium sp. CG_9.6]